MLTLVATPPLDTSSLTSATIASEGPARSQGTDVFLWQQSASPLKHCDSRDFPGQFQIDSLRSVEFLQQAVAAELLWVSRIGDKSLCPLGASGACLTVTLREEIPAYD